VTDKPSVKDLQSEELLNKDGAAKKQSFRARFSSVAQRRLGRDFGQTGLNVVLNATLVLATEDHEVPVVSPVGIP